MIENNLQSDKKKPASLGFALERLGQQIWATGIEDGSLRLGVNPKPDNQYMQVESYWVIPSAKNPKFLVPDASSKLAAGALTSYRGLRNGTANAARFILGLVAKSGLPLSRDRLVVQLRTGTANCSPLSILKQKMDFEQLHAATGVRLGLNAKPTLHLFDETGNPVGFAKMSWNNASTTLVENETRVLGELDGGSAALRVPRVLDHGVIQGRSYLVTQPLPAGVRGLSQDDPAPTPVELQAIAPLSGESTLLELKFFLGLQTKLDDLIVLDSGCGLCDPVQELSRRLTQHDRKLPVATRWHGDLVPWNCARDRDGTLWCWDLETSDDGPAAGMDILHWHFNVRRRGKSQGAVADFEGAVQDSRLHHRALGLDDIAVSLVAAVYALKLVERAWTLASTGSGWDRSWISEEELSLLLGAARTQLDSPIGRR